MLKITCAGKSDVGQKRSNNEDALIIRSDLGFLAVADGMGGAASGEVASSIFVDTTLELMSERNPDGIAAELIQKTFLVANDRILKQAREDPLHKGMGCTAELLVFDGQNYILGHVGDSRTYLLRGGKFRQVTKDHSLVQEQVDRGIITPAQARTHGMRNVIVRAVGVGETLAVDIIRGKIQEGDLFLLCSDGLTDMLEDQEIHTLLTLPMDLEKRTATLIDAGNGAGGHDNITVALCEIGSNTELSSGLLQM
jgi:PPM family protein phosphatase